MNRLLKLTIITLLLITPILSISLPVMGNEDEYHAVTSAFNVDQSSANNNVTPGSTIIHLDKGITEVYGPDNSLTLRIRDDEAPMINTPSGPMKATYVYELPSGAHITGDEKLTKVYFGRDIILTVIDGRKNGLIPPDFTGWLEQTNDWSVDDLDFFDAEWNVPSDPPDPEDDAVNFLFNAIENQAGNKILQPVLEWNQSGSGRWTGRAWYGSSGGYYCSSPVNASEGDSISGTMWYYNAYWGWVIQFFNNTTSQSTSITSNILGTSDLAVFCTLEVYNVGSDDDVPGDTTFDDMVFKYDNSSVDITWVAIDDIPPGSGLTYLYAQIYSDAKVKLHTAN